MKLLALNIQHGGGKRITDIVGYLLRVQADVLVLTEFRENANATVLSSALGKAGYNYFASPGPAPRQNSVALFSRCPFTSLASKTLPVADRQRFILGDFGKGFVAGVYFAQGDKKASLFRFLAEQAFPYCAEPYFVLGDFNTGLHHEDEAAATFACTNGFNRLLELGYHDSWRKRHPNAREFSWYSSYGNGFRIDHAFTNPAADAMIADIYYDHGPRDNRITDHSALVVELAANRVAGGI